MASNESRLSKGPLRKFSVLRKSDGDGLGEEVFGKWLAQQAKGAAARQADSVAGKLQEALADFVNDRSLRLANYGYPERRARGKGVLLSMDTPMIIYAISGTEH